MVVVVDLVIILVLVLVASDLYWQWLHRLGGLEWGCQWLLWWSLGRRRSEITFFVAGLLVSELVLGQERVGVVLLCLGVLGCLLFRQQFPEMP